jgi:hypothetical protein
MSTLLADTIRKTGGTAGVDIRVKNTSVYESEGGTSVTLNLVQGLIKGWAAVDGATDPSILDSHNVASITDSADGIVQTNFTSAFSSANHCTTTGLEIEDGSNSNYMYAQILIDKSAETTSRVEINTGFRAGSSAGFDKSFSYYHQTTGDLA